MGLSTRLHIRPWLLVLFVSTCMLLSVRGEALAQVIHRDSKGYDFWATFMENLGSSSTENSQLRLYMSCDRPTKVAITYQFDKRQHIVNIPVANVSVEVNLNQVLGNDIELLGVFPDASNEISRRAFHITCPDEITLYGVNIRTKSADAFMGIPEDILTGRYIVMAYTNGFTAFGLNSYDTPSEFAIIGTEQGTTVRITSPAIVNGRPARSPFTVMLDSGQVFFGQARIGIEQDVSGTEIVANKPVAVFGGCRRTSVPTSVGNYRDHLVEQMPPLEAWGKNAIVPPLYPITLASTEVAVVRVLSAFDGTNWTLNGVPQAPLKAARAVEVPITGVLVISADQPIIVAQYEHSVGIDDPLNGNDAGLGDPFMMLIPPTEQFDSVYSYQCVNHVEFKRHFVNVVVPSNAVASLRIDGFPVSKPFQPIAGTAYSYAQIEQSPGAHFASCDSMFGLYIYGYGAANSYGYTGGAQYETLVTDFQAPEISNNPQCDQLDGFAYDSHITDTGIDSCYSTPETKNVDLTIQSFLSGADTVRYHAVLLDPYQDGRVGIKAIDSGGRSQTRVTDIGGFTVRSIGMISQPVTLDTLISFNGEEFCRTVDLENYGKFEVEITAADFATGGLPGLRISTPMPLKIPAGSTASIEVCYDGVADTAYSPTLRIGNPCIERSIAQLPIISRIDRDPPVVSRASDPCLNDITVQGVEEYGRGSGVASVDVLDLVNGVATLTPDSTGFPTVQAQALFHRVDPHRDMIYRVRLRDRVGNEEIVSDTIAGFTLAVLGTTGDSLGLQYDNGWVGDSLTYTAVRCDSLLLTNFGLRTLTLDEIALSGNYGFSIPPSQLPIVLGPGESTKLAFCMEGRFLGDMEDTLTFTGQCGVGDAVLLKTPVALVHGTGRDACNNALSIQLYGPTKRTFLAAPVPNPVEGQDAYVDVGMSEAANVTMEVVDSDGRLVGTILRNISLDAGINRIRFDATDYDSGMYFIRMSTDHGGRLSTKLVVGR